MMGIFDLKSNTLYYATLEDTVLGCEPDAMSILCYSY